MPVSEDAMATIRADMDTYLADESGWWFRKEQAVWEAQRVDPAAPVPLTPTCPGCGWSLAFVGAPHAHPTCPHTACTIPRDPFEWLVSLHYARWPALFGRTAWSRWKIMDTLFCVIGTGYDWVDGTIQNTLEEDVWRWVTAFEDSRHPQFPRPQALIEAEWAARGKPTSFYDLGTYSLLCAVPDDVHPSFLHGAWDCLRMLAQVPHTRQRLMGNLPAMRHVREELTHRFGIEILETGEEENHGTYA